MQFQLENEKAKKIGEIGKIEMMLENEKNSTKRLEEEVGVFSKSYSGNFHYIFEYKALHAAAYHSAFRFWTKLRLGGARANFHSLHKK